jgi:hypothetical protein
VAAILACRPREVWRGGEHGCGRDSDWSPAQARRKVRDDKWGHSSATAGG